MSRKLVLSLLVFSVTSGLLALSTASSNVLQDGNRTYIVDQTGERWNVTQAKSIGFAPQGFQYGIGREAFTPLDGSYLREDSFFVRGDLPVIGVNNGSEAHAYSISKLSRHEIANTTIGSEAIAVGY